MRIEYLKKKLIKRIGKNNFIPIYETIFIKFSD